MRRYCLALLIFMTFPAFADTDYRCLQQCTNNGKSAMQCLSDCSYGEKPLPPGASGEAKATHKIFSAPQNAGNTLYMPHAAVKKAVPDKDYMCLAQCQQSGLQYQLCEKRCTVPHSNIEPVNKYQ